MYLLENVLHVHVEKSIAACYFDVVMSIRYVFDYVDECWFAMLWPHENCLDLSMKNELPVHEKSNQ